MLILPNVTMEPSKYEKQNKGNNKYEKVMVTCDIGTAQCNDEIVKCE